MTAMVENTQILNIKEAIKLMEMLEEHASEDMDKARRSTAGFIYLDDMPSFQFSRGAKYAFGASKEMTKKCL